MVAKKKFSGLAIVGQAPVVAERRDAAENRRKILAAAKQLLETRPIQEICMDEVARTAGVGKGTVYRRFEDRAALCRALLNDVATDLQNAALADFGVPSGSSWTQRINRLLEELFDFHANNAQILSEARSCSRGNRFEHPAHAWQRATLVAYLKQANHAGESSVRDAPFVADLVLSGLDPDLITFHMECGSSQSKLRNRFLASASQTLGLAD